MLTKYIEAAMRKSEVLPDDGAYYGEILGIRVCMLIKTLLRSARMNCKAY